MLLSTRTRNYIIVYSFLLGLIASIINIKYINDDEDKNEKERERYRFILPAFALTAFFVGCYFIALIIIAGESTGKDKFAGILFMFIVGAVLLALYAVLIILQS